MAYGNINGTGIGSLLRQIQEQKSQSPIVPPTTETGSPVRNVIQEPLKAAEDIGTSKVVSLRPEGIAGGQPEKAPEVLATPGPVIEQGIPSNNRNLVETSSGGLLNTETGNAVAGTSETKASGTKGFAESSFTTPMGRTKYAWAGMGGWSGEGGKRVYTPESGGETPVSAPSTEIKPEVSAPPIGTQITAKPTQRGESVAQYNAGSWIDRMAETDKNVAQLEEARKAGDLSIAETQARLAANLEKADAIITEKTLFKERAKAQNEFLNASNLLQTSPTEENKRNYDLASAKFSEISKQYDEAEAKAYGQEVAQESTNAAIKGIGQMAREMRNSGSSGYSSPSPTPTPAPKQVIKVPVYSTGTKISSGFSGGSVGSKSAGGGGGGGSWSAPAPQKSSAPKAPSIGTVLSGAIGQAWNKLFGKR